ncbi:hypothetical protein ACQ86F_21525 [Streptomyces venezuelae ATCC 10712]
MTPKRGDEVAPPAVGEEWRLRFATNEAAKGWGELGAEARATPGAASRRCAAIRSGRTTRTVSIGSAAASPPGRSEGAPSRSGSTR